MTRNAIHATRKPASPIPAIRSLRLALAQRHASLRNRCRGAIRARNVCRATATTLYYGLNSAYALSQVLFAALALLAISQGLNILGRWPGLILGFLAALSWLAICVLFPGVPAAAHDRCTVRGPSRCSGPYLMKHDKPTT